jgi:hypothetical protein
VVSAAAATMVATLERRRQVRNVEKSDIFPPQSDREAIGGRG